MMASNIKRDSSPSVQDLGVDFRKYLERSNFNEVITNALLTLYMQREWPRNPNEFICRKIAESCNLTLLDDHNNELNIARDKVRELEMNVSKLQEELYKCKLEKPNKKHKGDN